MSIYHCEFAAKAHQAFSSPSTQTIGFNLMMKSPKPVPGL